MKVIIAGSRTITNPVALDSAISSAINILNISITEVVCGMAKGADELGRQWAIKHNIPVTEFHAAWTRYGKSAGKIRNAQMAEYADVLIALWDGQSRGTEHMINKAKERNLKVYIHRTY
ncbi:MAG: SLOG family protein [Candidatus Cloacimonas sp.]